MPNKPEHASEVLKRVLDRIAYQNASGEAQEAKSNGCGGHQENVQQEIDLRPSRPIVGSGLK